MDKVKEKLQENTKILDPYAAMIPALVDLSGKAQLNPGALLAVALSFVFLILMLLQGWSILMLCIAVLYPAVHSIRAIESEDGGDDDKKWLTYWMVYGLLNVLETFFGFIFYFIPYWDWVRLGFFVWLLLPNFNGAMVLYEGVVKSLLDSNKDLIARWIKMATSAASDAQASAKKEMAAAASDPTLLAKGLSAATAAQEMAKDAGVEVADNSAAAEPTADPQE